MVGVVSDVAKMKARRVRFMGVKRSGLDIDVCFFVKHPVPLNAGTEWGQKKHLTKKWPSA